MKTNHTRLKASRPGLLVSVRNEQEVEDALAGGADWLDFKEPDEGALGAVSYEQAAQMVEKVRGRCPISAALGELVEWQQAQARRLLMVQGIEVVKLGLAGCAGWKEWSVIWKAVLQEVASSGKHLAAVIYADWAVAKAPQPEEVLELAIHSGANYLVIDTWDKASHSSLECFHADGLQRILKIARRANLQTVLAGKLQLQNIFSVVGLGSDLIAVRGAACQGSRSGRVVPAAVRSLRETIRRARDLMPEAPEGDRVIQGSHGKIMLD